VKFMYFFFLFEWLFHRYFIQIFFEIKKVQFVLIFSFFFQHQTSIEVLLVKELFFPEKKNHNWNFMKVIKCWKNLNENENLYLMEFSSLKHEGILWYSSLKFFDCSFFISLHFFHF
jgi:hypothetical protein